MNGTNAGTNSSAFSSTALNNNDNVTCTLTSTASCASPAIVPSNSIGMTINAYPAVPVITRNLNTLSCNATGVTYQWYLNNSSISGATNQTYSILQSGVYQVVVTNSSGCTTPSLNFSAYMPGINELSGMSNFNLFPNPAKDVVSLQFDLNKTKNIIFSVYDAAGKKVYEETKEFQPGPQIHQLRFWFLAKGNYMLQMKDGDSMIQRSVLIE